MIENKIKLSGKFELECGDYIQNLELCFHTSFEKYDNQKVVWICHALTASSNPEEWWNDIVGKGKLFDTSKYFVVCVNMLGSCYGSSSPASVNPKTSKPYMLSFPQITVRDIVKSLEEVRKHLLIDKIDMLIGGSIGGFQALEWAITNPQIIENLCLLATSPKISAWATAFNESQRMCLMADKDFVEQKNINSGKNALKAARSIALLSYRSYDGYNSTQSEIESNNLFASKSASYQRYQGQKLANRFDAYSYYTLTKCVDSQNVARGRESIEKALKQITAKTICIGIDSDILFPYSEQKYMSENIKNSKFYKIHSTFGHDGFLLEHKQITEIIRNICKY